MFLLPGEDHKLEVIDLLLKALDFHGMADVDHFLHEGLRVIGERHILFVQI